MKIDFKQLMEVSDKVELLYSSKAGGNLTLSSSIVGVMNENKFLITMPIHRAKIYQIPCVNMTYHQAEVYITAHGGSSVEIRDVSYVLPIETGDGERRPIKMEIGIGMGYVTGHPDIKAEQLYNLDE